MAESPPSAGANRFEVRVTSDSHFAWLRTRLSVERTMMSWLRTAVSLIGFGFALAGMASERKRSPVVAVAILLICIGLFAFSAVILRLI
jgi:putative membrane protein